MLHIGDTFDRNGERLIVKRIEGNIVTVEDEYGFAFDLPYEPSMVKREYAKPTDLDERARGYTAHVDRDGFVTEFEDDEPDEDSVENREGDPAFNGAFNAW